MDAVNWDVIWIRYCQDDCAQEDAETFLNFLKTKFPNGISFVENEGDLAEKLDTALTLFFKRGDETYANFMVHEMVDTLIMPIVTQHLGNSSDVSEIVKYDEIIESNEWISVDERMPKFYNDNVLSERVIAKSADGIIEDDVSLCKSNHGILCYGATKEKYHSNITHWKKMPKSSR